MISQHARLVAQMLKAPGWKQGRHTLDHTCGLKLWTSNGWSYLHVHEPINTKFSLLEKLYLWPKVKRAGRLSTLETLSNLLLRAK